MSHNNRNEELLHFWKPFPVNIAEDPRHGTALFLPLSPDGVVEIWRIDNTWFRIDARTQPRRLFLHVISLFVEQLPQKYPLHRLRSNLFLFYSTLCLLACQNLPARCHVLWTTHKLWKIHLLDLLSLRTSGFKKVLLSRSDLKMSLTSPLGLGAWLTWLSIRVLLFLAFIFQRLLLVLFVEVGQ